jgi:hypothetical protein
MWVVCEGLCKAELKPSMFVASLCFSLSFPFFSFGFFFFFLVCLFCFVS